jgi:hypothetical protein
MGLFWMSFCDPSKPEGQQFTGVALVEADSLPEAITMAWATGCNPGGEIQSAEVPLDLLPNDKRVLLAKAPKHTLMDRAALEAHGLLD